MLNHRINMGKKLFDANMLYRGEGIKMNKEEAAKYFKMAADEGDINAITGYAILLKNSEGISMNKEEAAKYFKMASDNSGFMENI